MKTHLKAGQGLHAGKEFPLRKGRIEGPVNTGKTVLSGKSGKLPGILIKDVAHGEYWLHRLKVAYHLENIKSIISTDTAALIGFTDRLFPADVTSNTRRGDGKEFSPVPVSPIFSRQKALLRFMRNQIPGQTARRLPRRP
jgi:hypothetical protein